MTMKKVQVVQGAANVTNEESLSVIYSRTDLQATRLDSALVLIDGFRTAAIHEGHVVPVELTVELYAVDRQGVSRGLGLMRQQIGMDGWFNNPNYAMTLDDQLIIPDDELIIRLKTAGMGMPLTATCFIELTTVKLKEADFDRINFNIDEKVYFDVV